MRFCEGTNHLSLIIDGYNLIHAIGLLPAEANKRKYPPGTLEEAREGLLRLLIRGLSAEAAHQTTVVFDALEPPEFLPDAYRQNGIRIQFARDYRDADELIIELILKHARGAHLTVVSSDHRIQAAARRRKADFYDSDSWYFGSMPVDLAPRLKKGTRADSGTGTGQGNGSKAKPRPGMRPENVLKYKRDSEAREGDYPGNPLGAKKRTNPSCPSINRRDEKTNQVLTAEEQKYWENIFLE